jgi:hypothetical protein
MHRRTRLSKISALRRNRDAFGVSKELFCGLPQLWERAHCEIEKKRTDRILTAYAPVQEPVSLLGLRFPLFPRSPLPFFAAPLCQTSLLINGAGRDMPMDARIGNQVLRGTGTTSDFGRFSADSQFPSFPARKEMVNGLMAAQRLEEPLSRERLARDPVQQVRVYLRSNRF